MGRLSFVLVVGCTVGWLSLCAAACGSSDTAVDGGGNGVPGTILGTDCEVDGTSCAVLCDGTLGCVDCAANSDCGAAAPACIAGSCEACATASDCKTGESCFPKDHRCEAACKVNGDCDKDSPICDPDSGACVGCLDVDDCGAGKPICSTVTQQCVECAGDADCGNERCDAEGKCRECFVDGHCPTAAPLCSDHECRSGCRADTDCSGGDPLCDTARSQCVECLGDRDCPTAEPVCRRGGKCVECTQNDHCTGTTRNLCDDRSCVQCIEDTDCADTERCRDSVCEAR